MKVISYDRLIRDTASVDYYVTFDSVQVGRRLGQVPREPGSHGQEGNNLYIYAGAASDNNAFLFFQGAWSVLQPKIADGTFIVRNSSRPSLSGTRPSLPATSRPSIIGQTTTNWNFNDAKNKAEANLTAVGKHDKGTVFICAPNDGTARAIADAFAADKDVTKYYITGQDAEIASIQYIIDGKQSMTVLKDVRTLVCGRYRRRSGLPQRRLSCADHDLQQRKDRCSRQADGHRHRHEGQREGRDRGLRLLARQRLHRSVSRLPLS